MRLDHGARPERFFDDGLQHERTALAWERTAVSTMVAGALLARYGATDGYPIVAVLGIVQVAFGGVLLVWTGHHYEQLHGPLRAGENPSHPLAIRILGTATTAGVSIALLTVIVMLLTR